MTPPSVVFPFCANYNFPKRPSNSSSHRDRSMATPDVIPFEQLLAPISDAEPCGRDPRANNSHQSSYWTIRASRDRSISAEKQLRHATDDDVESIREKIEWAKVTAQSQAMFAKEAKCLEVLAFYIEALVRQHGFIGLRGGMRLARELLQRYWEQIHPHGDVAAERISLLRGLGKSLIDPAQKVSLTEPASDGRARTRLDYLTNAPDFEQAASGTGGEFCKKLCQDIEYCLAEVEELDHCIQNTCEEPPSFGPLRTEISTYIPWLRDLYKVQLEAPVASVLPTNGQTELSSSVSAAASYPAVEAHSRERAFKQLLEVADFFERTEPHSPVSYCLRQAVRWGQMKLPELLSELIPDEKIRDDLFKRVGVDRLPDTSKTSE